MSQSTQSDATRVQQPIEVNANHFQQRNKIGTVALNYSYQYQLELKFPINENKKKEFDLIEFIKENIPHYA